MNNQQQRDTIQIAGNVQHFNYINRLEKGCVDAQYHQYLQSYPTYVIKQTEASHWTP